MTTRFTYIPLASPLHDEAAVTNLIADYVPVLARRGGERRDTGAADVRTPLLVLVVSGGTEQAILELWERRNDSFPEEPLFLIAHPGHNSLPAALEALARLQQRDVRGRIIYLSRPDDEAASTALAEAVEDLEVRRALRETRIGLIGKPSDWLVASSPDAAVVREIWGPQVVPLDLDVVYERYRATPNTTSLAEELTDHAAAHVEADGSRIHDAASFATALSATVEQERLDAVTVRCFDVLFDLGTSGCVALSRLNDEQTIAGCEGDLVSTVGMLWAHRLLGVLPWMANPARLDAEAGTVWLAHCTVPRSLVDSYSLLSHFESGLGVGIHGRFPPGPVTLLRIGGPAMERLWVAEGEILRSGNDPTLCRTQIEILLGPRPVARLLEAPLGNHLVVVPGHHRARLERWQRIMVPAVLDGSTPGAAGTPAAEGTAV